MNIRFTNALDALPARVQRFPQAWGRLGARTRWLGGALAVVVILALAWYFLDGQSGAGRNPSMPVVVAKAASKDVIVVEHTIGTVVANTTVQVTARVSGQLMTAYFKEGQTVRAGDLLFRIDPKPYTAALDQARAQMAKDSALLANAVNDRRRFDALFAQNAASSQQRDQADATAKSMAATVAADRAVLDIAQLNLGYTDIRSPVDGKTGPILIQPGNLIGAGGSNALVVVAQIQPVKVSFSLPQTDLPQIQARDRTHELMAFVSPREAGGQQLTAPVDFITNEINAQTGTIELRATFDNRDQQLVPGQLVDVAVSLQNLKRATTVPREAVNDGPNGRYVYVVTPSKAAEMRPVKVLFDDGINMAVSGGIKPGDKVVTDGQLRLVPGAMVSVEEAGGRKAKSADAP